MNLELDKKIAEKIMGLEVVGQCRAWDPEGSGYSISRPEEDTHHGDVMLVYVSTCSCEIMPLKTFTSLTQEREFVSNDLGLEEFVANYNKEMEEEFVNDKALWGHSRHCLSVVEEYTTDIRATHTVIEKIIGNDYSFDLGYHPHNTAPWVALFAKYPANIEFNTGRGYGKTAAMAICLAALDTIRD